MPAPIYLPPPRDPFESILPFAMQLYAMKQRKDIAEAELSQRKEERAATAKTHEETLRAGMMQHGFEAVPREEAQDQNMPSGQAIGGLNWKRPQFSRQPQVIQDSEGNKAWAIRDATGEWKIQPISNQKEVSDIEKYNLAKKQGYPGTFMDYQKELKAAGASKTNVNITNDIGQKALVELGKEMGTNLAKSHKDTMDMSSSLSELYEARKMLEEPMITGAGANSILFIGKALQQMGISSFDDPIKNTEAYYSRMAKETASIIKSFGAGTGLSDADRQYANRAAGGDITLSKQSLKEIVKINEKAKRNIIRRHNKLAKQAMSKEGAENLPYSLMVDIPKKGEAPPEAIEYLKKHPGTKGDFEDKYGYLPED